LPATRQQLTITKWLTIWLTIWLSVCNGP